MHNAPKAVCHLLLIMAKAYSSNSDRAVLDLGSASPANDATRDTAKSCLSGLGISAMGLGKSELLSWGAGDAWAERAGGWG
jgi:hypothetical protein